MCAYFFLYKRTARTKRIQRVQSAQRNVQRSTVQSAHSALYILLLCTCLVKTHKNI